MVKIFKTKFFLFPNIPGLLTIPLKNDVFSLTMLESFAVTCEYGNYFSILNVEALLFRDLYIG